MHTMILFQQIHPLDFPIVSSHLATLSKEKKARYFADKDCPGLRIYTLYNEYGITIMLRRTKISATSQPNGNKGSDCDEKGFYYHAIELRLNPKVLIQKNEYVKVAKASDYKAIREQFKKILKPLQEEYEMHPGLNFYRFNDITEYQVKRIDYCINIRSKLHEVYMGLIRRADVPSGFIMLKEIDEKSGRGVAFKQSFYIQTKNHSVGVNIYNKEYQMHNQFADYEHLEDACNIIRIEIQCLTAKTNSMKQKNKWRYREFINFADDNISRQMICYYYKKTVGFEEYYTLEKAKERVYSCDHYRGKTIKSMIEVLELVNQKRSIHQARLAYSGNLENKEDVDKFNSIIKKIRKSGINPVTIPVNWGYEHIPNLIEEMDKEFTQQLRVVIN